MNRPSLKLILLFFVIMFVMSRTGKMMAFFSRLNLHGILTIEPWRKASEGERYILTVLLAALCFVIIWSIFILKK
ncbi:MAG: hypothetical protein A2Z25_21195 [Planctomycetes bacterium RBG_16_55_9]|nr:MAG: hypothetical protein A2Z25_21195 [Planctomycetes bacterium RBG_16_55_9]